MKKKLIMLVIGFISTLATQTSVQAQSTNFASVLDHKEAISLENATPADPKNASDLSGINTKAIKDFTRFYKNISGEQWSVNPDGFSAVFTADNMRTTVFYDRKGRWAGSMKGYTENKMSPALRKQVKREYFDFTITYVQEIETLETKGLPVYLVHLQDNKNIILLRVNEDAMDVYQQYDKQ